MSNNNTEEINYGESNKSSNKSSNNQNDLDILPENISILSIPLSIDQHIALRQIYGIAGYNAYIQYLINNPLNGRYNYHGARRIAEQVYRDVLENQIEQFRIEEREILRPPLRNITQFPHLHQNGSGSKKKRKKIKKSKKVKKSKKK